MLKTTTDVISPALAKVFNTVLTQGHFPSICNVAYQVPVFKKGNPLNCNNYRGISLTSCFGKAFTCLLNKRLQTVLEEENKISQFQGAFRESMEPQTTSIP